MLIFCLKTLIMLFSFWRGLSSDVEETILSLLVDPVDFSCASYIFHPQKKDITTFL